MAKGSMRSQRRPQPKAADAGGGIVRVAALRGIPSLLRERGLDAGDILVGLGHDPGVLDDAGSRISYSAAGRLLQRCAETTGCEHFGLLVGQLVDGSSLGILGALIRCSPSVAAALRSLILHTHLQTRGGMPTHGVEGEWATLGYAIYQRDMSGAAQVYDMSIAIAFNVMRSLCGRGWLPGEVCFSRARPRDVRPYRQFFRCPLRFDAECTSLLFSKASLDQVPPGSDADLHRRLQHALAAEELLKVDDQAEGVRRALRTMIPTGRASETLVSELFSISIRTLRRRLAAQGSSFRTLGEEVRGEIARQLLADTNLTATEIAAALEYADASAFTRAFRRWTGTPPTAWRTKLRSA